LFNRSHKPFRVHRLILTYEAQPHQH
jgi:hypothetical protein